jgi:hypothetical protein
MTWVIQQLREATPFGHRPRFLFRDNDGIYGYEVRRFLDACGGHCQVNGLQTYGIPKYGARHWS